MNKPALQQRLNQHSGLLGTQRQLLQRLLLQLEFNRPDRLQLVGGSGSGKSTLMLALAEICSEHFNIALVQAEAGLQLADLLRVMQQHWFGSGPLAKTQADFFAQLQPKERFLLLIDDADQLSDECWQLIQALPITVFISVLQARSDIKLAIHLIPVSEEEARELLQPYGLTARDMQERADDCAGDLHLLFVGLSRNPSARQFKAQPRDNPAFEATDLSEEKADPVLSFAASAAGSKHDPVGLRALRTEQESSIELVAEPRVTARTTHAPVKASTASGQFFSPFLVLSIGFSLIAAVVMFWLWSEQQFRQPVAPDLIPYLPDNVQQRPTQAFTQTVAPAPDVQNVLEKAGTSQNTQVGTISKPAFSDEGMPAMALPRTETVPDESNQPQSEANDVVSPADNSQQPVSEVNAEVANQQQQTPVNQDEPAIEVEAQQTAAEPIAKAAAEPVTAQTDKAQTPPANSAEPPKEADLVAEMADETQSRTKPATLSNADAPAILDEPVLLQMLPDAAAIQLGVFSQYAAAASFVQKYKTLDLKLYQRLQQGKLQFVVVSASYVNATAARQQVKTLPQELKQQTPFVKSLNAVQQEIQDFAGQ